MSNFGEFIKQQMLKLPSRYAAEIKGDYCWIKCPLHGGGRESTASLRINLERHGSFGIGSAKCFGCAAFIPNWEKLATILGAAPGTFSEEAEEVYSVISKDERDAMLGTEDDRLPDFEAMLPWNEHEDWRGIKGKMLCRIGAFLHFSEIAHDTQVYLPCFVNDDHVGGIYAAMTKPKNKKYKSYINTPGPWALKSFFCYDYTKKMLKRRKLKTLFLVEGPRDTLRPLQYGIPTMGMIGAGNWSDIKADLILSLDLERLILGFDPDEAGDRATQKVFNDLKNYVDIRRYKMRPEIKDAYGNVTQEGEDPGNLSMERLRKLKSHIY